MVFTGQARLLAFGRNGLAVGNSVNVVFPLYAHAIAESAYSLQGPGAARMGPHASQKAA